VFAKAAKEVRQAKAQSRGSNIEPISSAPPSSRPLQSEGRDNNVPQSWDLEYRWPK
jgi:hypothetical protein